MLSDASIQCWGRNTYGQLGDGTTTTSYSPVTVSGLSNTATAVSSGYAHTCALLADTSIQCWGYNGKGQLGDGSTTTSSSPVAVSGSLTASKILAGTNHTCSIATDGSVSCWGDNSYGKLGQEYIESSTTPLDTEF